MIIMSFYSLEPGNWFVVTYYMGDIPELLIINTYLGKVMKIEYPCEHLTTQRLASFVKEEGVCTEDGDYCRILAKPYDITSRLVRPRQGESDKLYEKIVDFALLGE
jgi:hypothetical protein